MVVTFLTMEVVCNYVVRYELYVVLCTRLTRILKLRYSYFSPVC
jgi:hypothetical protein